jgi:TonB family protein
MFVRPRPAPFAVSLLTHGLLLVWVASGPVREKPASLYAQAIAPHVNKLVWYNFREKLPDVSPTAVRAPAKPPRADVKLPSQQIVAGAAKAPRARQFVWQPAPKLELQTDLRSPNVLAIHVPRPAPPKPKLFVPPPEAPKPATAANALAAPPEIRTARSLSDAGNLPGMQPAKAPSRKFVAPRSGSPLDKPAPALPDAPAVAAANPAMAAPAMLRSSVAKPAPRDFVAPRQNGKPSPFGSPLPDAPALPESASSSAVSMAIVGLNPTANAPAPAPEGSRNAQFSAGPQPRKGGADGSADAAILTVPGLLIRSEAPDAKPMRVARASPTSAANLRAAVRSGLPATSVAGAHPAAIRVSSAPDAAWNGRDTYAMSVQMPNVTSYTGSWMIWFAERRDEPGAGGVLSPPVPLRKVDPKYFPAAMADRVEGKVRLAAVIRKDGRVDSVRLLQHLDDRLDQSAQEAMDKWQFEPALRNGQPVDVDAVIEIPFRLAPTPNR